MKETYVIPQAMSTSMTEKELSFTVAGTPQPWCVWTRRSRQPLQHQKMQSYQADIQCHAKKAMSDLGMEPHPERVVLCLYFFMEPESYWRQDLTNLIKSAEDALKGIVFIDDKQVVRQYTYKEQDSKHPRTEFLIVLLGPHD